MDLFNNSSPSIGFTGTGHKPLTPEQKCILTVKLLCYWKEGYRTFHHGDCIHADSEAHEIAYRTGFHVVIHPPTKESKRAFCGQGRDNVVVLPAKPYLERNHDIVDNSEILIACPKELTEQLRSGTWATVRYARKQNKKVIIIHPR